MCLSNCATLHFILLAWTKIKFVLHTWSPGRSLTCKGIYHEMKICEPPTRRPWPPLGPQVRKPCDHWHKAVCYNRVVLLCKVSVFDIFSGNILRRRTSIWTVLFCTYSGKVVWRFSNLSSFSFSSGQRISIFEELFSRNSETGQRPTDYHLGVVCFGVVCFGV